MVLTDENGFWNYIKASINTLIVSHNNNIWFSYFANVKHTWNSMQAEPLNQRFQNSFTIRLMYFVPTQEKYRSPSTSHSSFGKI